MASAREKKCWIVIVENKKIRILLLYFQPNFKVRHKIYLNYNRKNC